MLSSTHFSASLLLAFALCASSSLLDKRQSGQSGLLNWSECPTMPHPQCDYIDNCPQAGLSPTPCDCTQEMINALYACPAELGNCLGMSSDAFTSGFDQIILAWHQRCTSALASITTPISYATATGSGGICNIDANNPCIAGQTSLDRCTSQARVGSTTNFPSLTSCACQPALLRTLSKCWFTDEPQCLGKPPDTSRIKNNYLVQMCDAAKTIFPNGGPGDSIVTTAGSVRATGIGTFTGEVTGLGFRPAETGKSLALRLSVGEHSTGLLLAVCLVLHGALMLRWL